ncbi:MAG TPA: Mpo1-like protein [Chthonomonadales bacterium]|nr:Mpo1-like protein [Chthonomonadales bacterium]
MLPIDAGAAVGRARLDLLLTEYGESHQDRTNKLVHWLCVPLITWCAVALLWCLPEPRLATALRINWAVAAILICLLYYARFGLPIVLGMAFALASMAAAAAGLYAAGLPVARLAAGLFIAAWIGQFIGHKIEGKKPSFLRDIQFLLIGPLWLLTHIFRRFGVCY